MNYKKILFFCLVTILVCVGSLHCFNTTNLLMSDIANVENNFNMPLTFVTFSHLSLTLGLIAFFFYAIRSYNLEEKYRNHMIKTYGWIYFGLGLFGLISSILVFAVVYKTAHVIYPYEGAGIIALILNILMMLAGILSSIFVIVKKLPCEKKPQKKIYILRTIVMAILSFMAFNRFGAFLSAPYYTEWNYFYLTFPFYLTLLVPLAIMIIFVLFRIRVLNKKENTFSVLIASAILFVLSLGLCLTVMILGMNEPLLVSLISPAMPLERLATIPVDFIFLVLCTVVPSFITVLFEVKKLLKVRRLKEAK